MKKDITKECLAKLDFSNNNEALIYLYDPKGKEGTSDVAIGLFDCNGFHYMKLRTVEATYYVEGGYVAHDGIVWFKVLKEV